MSDDEVALRVRMLMGSDLDHEFVCTLARDRIMALVKEKAALMAMVPVRHPASKLPNHVDFYWVWRGGENRAELAFFDGQRFIEPDGAGDREGLSVERIADVVEWCDFDPPNVTRQPPDDSWIPVDDRLPVPFERVLVFDPTIPKFRSRNGIRSHNSVEIGYYRGENDIEPWYVPDGTKPTHWKPLPSDPVTQCDVTPVEFANEQA